jgi:hypothetical protein
MSDMTFVKDTELANFLEVVNTEVRAAILEWAHEYNGNPTQIDRIECERDGAGFRLILVMENGERIAFPFQCTAEVAH